MGRWVLPVSGIKGTAGNANPLPCLAVSLPLSEKQRGLPLNSKGETYMKKLNTFYDKLQKVRDDLDDMIGRLEEARDAVEERHLMPIET